MIKRHCFSLAVMLGGCLLSACSAFSRIVKHSDPLMPDEHIRLGAVYEAQGLTDAAARQYEAALRLQKTHIPARMGLGNIAFAMGDLKNASAHYRRILRLDRVHVGANNNLAMVCLARGKEMDKAERYALTALKQGGPLRPYVMETLASLYIKQARLTEARKILDEADAAAPADNLALREQLVLTRAKLGPEVVIDSGSLDEK